LPSLSKKTKMKSKRSDFQRSGSHGDLFAGDIEVALGESLDNSLHGSSKRSPKITPKVRKKLKFGKKPKRYMSAGDVQSTLQGTMEDFPATDAL
jgi:hypothetical protein